MSPLRHSTQNHPAAPRPTTAAGGAPAGDQAGLAGRIRNGDPLAWRELIDRHEPLLRRIARQYRLSSQDADDVVQFTWLRCLEHIDQLTQADRLHAWLGTICRRECLRVATKGPREVPLDETAVTRLIDSTREDRDPSAEAVLRDSRARLGRAVAALPDRQRLVLLELLEREGHGYRDVSHRLGLPVGSIGPTWQRALARLRRDPELADLRPAS
jgi:RNA polymerase sigma factor (sigma-70 family)